MKHAFTRGRSGQEFMPKKKAVKYHVPGLVISGVSLFSAGCDIAVDKEWDSGGYEYLSLRVHGFPPANNSVGGGTRKPPA